MLEGCINQPSVQGRLPAVDALLAEFRSQPEEDEGMGCIPRETVAFIKPARVEKSLERLGDAG